MTSGKRKKKKHRQKDETLQTGLTPTSSSMAMPCSDEFHGVCVYICFQNTRLSWSSTAIIFPTGKPPSVSSSAFSSSVSPCVLHGSLYPFLSAALSPHSHPFFSACGSSPSFSSSLQAILLRLLHPPLVRFPSTFVFCCLVSLESNTPHPAAHHRIFSQEKMAELSNSVPAFPEEKLRKWSLVFLS